MKKAITIFIIVSFLATGQLGIFPACAATGGVFVQEFHLPAPGVLVHLSPLYNPPILKGIKVHPDNPFRFEFILDRGDQQPGDMASAVSSSRLPSNKALNVKATQRNKVNDDQELRIEAIKLIKYFLASLTIPEKDLWVNLSPYEKDRIIPQSFGLTEMGRDLLAEDYMLKQITASLIYPEDEIGKKFWKRVYEEAAKKFGTTNIPVNTFNKVWIIPQKALIYENTKVGTAYIVESKLKVMLEQDYLSMQHHYVETPLMASHATRDDVFKKGAISDVSTNDVNALGSKIVREIIIPELTREVNEGKNFAQLRQVYNSLILATWYKRKIKDSILSQVYEDKKKIAGVQYTSSVILSSEGTKDLNTINPNRDSSPVAWNDTERIYHRYLQAFKKGAFNLIKEDQDYFTQEKIPRKYFSGGETFVGNVEWENAPLGDTAQKAEDLKQITVNMASLSNDLVMDVQSYKYYPRRIGILGFGFGKNIVNILLIEARKYTKLKNKIGVMVRPTDKNKDILQEMSDKNSDLLGIWPDKSNQEIIEASTAVIIASPADQHYASAKMALEAGKDVYIEKPFTIDPQQARELVALAQAKHCILMVGHILLWLFLRICG